MLISELVLPENTEFVALLNNTLQRLNEEAKKKSDIISKLHAQKLENFICEVMSEEAFDTPFKDSIKLVSGQAFPDIIAKKFFGVEVKSTNQNHWKTTGNSVKESTRHSDVKKIYMMFGKLAHPIEFKCRPYEECLSEVVVTHSPRYLVDMNLKHGNTIFDKMAMPYDQLRIKDKPIKFIVDYYRRNLRDNNGDVWWIDDSQNTSNLIIKTWSGLDSNTKKLLKVKAMVYFPEIFGNNNNKYSRIAVWLMTQEGIVCPNIRDNFSAGGQGDFIYKDKKYRNIPKTILNLIDNFSEIKLKINELSSTELSEQWKVKTSNKTKFNDWINLVSEYLKSFYDLSELPILEMFQKS